MLKSILNHYPADIAQPILSINMKSEAGLIYGPIPQRNENVLHHNFELVERLLRDGPSTWSDFAIGIISKMKPKYEITD